MSVQTSNDLEIYLLKADVDALESWLSNTLGEIQADSGDNQTHRWTHLASGMRIIFTPKADGNFGCLWFKTNDTPWSDDLACARAAHSALNVEVRCASTEWNETASDDSPAWVKPIRGEEKLFDWH